MDGTKIDITFAIFGLWHSSVTDFNDSTKCVVYIQNISRNLLTHLKFLILKGYNSFAIVIAIFSRTCVSAAFAVIILHTAEMFPTELRNSAIGLNSTMAHVGTIAAPYIADFFGTLAWYIPTTICGITLIIAGLLILILPETKNIELYDMMVENEAQPNKSS